MSAWIIVLGSLCSSAMTPNCVRYDPETVDTPLCLSDMKLLATFPDKVWVSDMQELNMMLTVEDDHAELIQFASAFGLTFCYDHGNVFLPNTIREWF
jgi:hypothetical protein